MKHGSLTSIFAAFAACMLFASAAHAQSTVPPGNGEADQYAETVPGAGGNQTPDGSKDPNDVLPPDQVDDLQNGGAAAAGVAAFTAATAPDDASGNNADDSSSTEPGSKGSAGADDGPPPAAADNPIPAQDDLGVWLWILVGVAAAGAVGFAAGRIVQRRG